MGYSSTLLTYPDDGIAHNAVSQWDESSRISFRFLSDRQAFEIGIPALGPRQLESCRAVSGLFALCFAGKEPISNRTIGVNLIRPDYPLLPLETTSLVSYNTADGPTVLTPTTLYSGVLAYGVPSPINAIPSAGTSSGSAVVLAGDRLFSAALQFDFNRRSVSGTFTYVIPPNEYDEKQVALEFDIILTGNIAPDGRITGTIAGGAAAGRFDGLFTGDKATEVMLRLSFSGLKGSAAAPVYGALAGQVTTPVS